MALRPASFKGVPFYVETAEGEYGRRFVLHKYPYRDIPFLEDLGRDTRQFKFTAFVMDKAGHDALIKALESPQGGTLIHPFYGSQFVTLAEEHARVRYPRCEGGRFEFDLTFVEAGQNNEPDAQEDAAGLLESLINDALNAVGLDFVQKWLDEIAGWADIAASRIDALMACLESFLAPFEKALASIKSIINSGQQLLSKPLELYYRVKGVIHQITHLQVLPFGTKLNLGRTLARNESLQVTNRVDPTERNFKELAGQSLQPANRPEWTYPYSAEGIQDIPPLPPSLADAVRRNLVLNQALDIATDDYDSKLDISMARDQVIELIDHELQQADGNVYLALQKVRTQVIFTAQARMPLLRDVKTIKTKTVLPALILTYQVNGTINQYADVITRNHVTHPLFVPAGNIEVLRDGQ